MGRKELSTCFWRDSIPGASYLGCALVVSLFHNLRYTLTNRA